jgi:hypothetical protein
VFDSAEEQTFSYNLSLFKSCHKAIARAEQVNIRMNEIGMLSLQFVIHPVPSWIDFLLSSNSNEEDASQREESQTQN